MNIEAEIQTILDKYADKTVAQMQAALGKDPTDDADIKRHRRDALHHKILIDQYGIENKSVAEMDSIVGIKGAGMLAKLSGYRKQQRIIEDGVKRVDKYEANHARWVAAGRPADMLKEINGNISVRAE